MAQKYEKEKHRKLEIAHRPIEEYRKLEMARLDADRAEKEAERTDRAAQRQVELARLEAEKAEREARLKLEMAEREADRATEAEFRKAQLDWQQHQIKLLEDRDKSEKNKEDAKVVQLKKYGDALRNSVMKLGADPIEIIAFFDNIERQFKELNVPKELCVSLMKPYLNDRARTLINRVDASHSADYYYVKDFLLKEFRLVPQQLLEAFNTSTRQSHETFKTYITRLSMLLDYYLNSRNVTSIVELKELLVCDRVKTVLSECMVNHVLRSEVSLPRTYASPNELADILDKYCANFDQNGRPRVSAIGLGVKRHTPNQGIAVAQPQSLPFYPSTSKSQTKNSQPASAAATPVVAPGRRCFKCGLVFGWLIQFYVRVSTVRLYRRSVTDLGPHR
jgi:hypothetical protein